MSTINRLTVSGETATVTVSLKLMVSPFLLERIMNSGSDGIGGSAPLPSRNLQMIAWRTLAETHSLRITVPMMTSRISETCVQ
jgi:hypothetical protein